MVWSLSEKVLYYVLVVLALRTTDGFRLGNISDRTWAIVFVAIAMKLIDVTSGGLVWFKSPADIARDCMHKTVFGIKISLSAFRFAYPPYSFYLDR